MADQTKADHEYDNDGRLDLAGSSSTYTATTARAITGYHKGLRICGKANHTNTGATTLNVNGLGAVSVRKGGNTALVGGEILENQYYDFLYESGNSVFQLLNPTIESFPAGTAMLFAQTSAPTGWTKDTNYDEHALRVVSGTASSGGSVDFTTAFASQAVAGTVGDTTLTLSQIPAHGHPFYTTTATSPNANAQGGFSTDQDGTLTVQAAFSGTPTGTEGQQIGGSGGGGSHTHTFSGTAIDLDVNHLDVILAIKD